MSGFDWHSFWAGFAGMLGVWCVILCVAYWRDCRYMRRITALKPLYKPAWHALQTGSLTQGIQSIRHAKNVIKELERAYPDLRSTLR